MGVSGGIKVLHAVKGLTRGELAHIVRGLAEAQEVPPTVVVDVSNILYELDLKIKAAAEYLVDLAATGLTVRPVCDNDTRPKVKQATNLRRARKEKNRSEEYLLRKKVRLLKKSLVEDSLNQQQRDTLLKEIKELEKRRKTKETASTKTFIPNLQDELERELDLLGAHIMNSAGGKVLEVVTEFFGKESENFAGIEAEEVVQTYIDALVYEPTNAKDEPQTFLFDAPKHLSLYCKEFSAPNTIINRGPLVLICKGVGGVCHDFLAASGYSTCSKCNHIMCSHCQGTTRRIDCCENQNGTAATKGCALS